MNMFARFDENPAMNLQDIKNKSYGRMDGRTGGGGGYKNAAKNIEIPKRPLNC